MPEIDVYSCRELDSTSAHLFKTEWYSKSSADKIEWEDQNLEYNCSPNPLSVHNLSKSLDSTLASKQTRRQHFHLSFLVNGVD